jgi:hypothetical protein
MKKITGLIIPAYSNDARRFLLAVNEGNLTPEFDPAITDYMLNVANSVSSITITAIKNHSCNNGTSNEYAINSSSVAHAYWDIAFTPSSADYQFGFDWKGVDENESRICNRIINNVINDNKATFSCNSCLLKVYD